MKQISRHFRPQRRFGTLCWLLTGDKYLQHTRTRGTDERTDCHVDVSWTSLMAVETFFVTDL